jgi:hypothetical protein
MRPFAGGLATALTAIALTAGARPPAIAAAQVVRDAQSPLLSLRPGDTVRVWSSVPPLAGMVGLIARLEPDTLALRDLPGRRTLRVGAAIALPALRRLEVRRGQRRSVGWTLTGVVLGMAGGALVGSLAGVALECGGSCSDQGDLAGLAGLVVGGGVGGLAGGIVGGVIGGQRRPRWQPVALPAP